MAVRLSLAALAAILMADLAFAIDGAGWLSLPLALAGWYLADFMSGAIHMAMDYRPSRPGIGLGEIYFYQGSRESEEYLALRRAAFARMGPLDRLTYDFKNHHPRPAALGRRSMLTQVGATTVATTLPFAVLANAALWAAGAPPVLFTGLVSFLLGATFAQYFHGTLHRADNPWPVRLLRRLRLLMTPADHEHHHRTLDRDFSTINGWSNPVLNRAFDALRRRGYMPDEGLTPN